MSVSKQDTKTLVAVAAILNEEPALADTLYDGHWKKTTALINEDSQIPCHARHYMHL